ncbi:low-density lipoprotein receptor-related protein 3-like [Lathamus discolor]|uniref:low-density lipoprotein receptor-related protein 3-like n=1 Tax=Lathamus discolor TaxID=678569 RepID=UPI0032B708EF
MEKAASAELRQGALVSLTAICLASCSGKLKQHTERRGVIYSPSWPLNYPPAVDCIWFIQGDHGDMITISCLKGLETSSTADAQQLEINLLQME